LINSKERNILEFMPAHLTPQYLEAEARFGKDFPMLPVSAKEGMNLDEVRKEVYRILGIIRVYTKSPGSRR